MLKLPRASDLSEQSVTIATETPQQQVYRAGFEKELSLKLAASSNWKGKTMRVYLPYNAQLLHPSAVESITSSMRASEFGVKFGQFDSSCWADSDVDMRPCIWISFPPVKEGDKDVRYSCASF